MPLDPSIILGAKSPLKHEQESLVLQRLQGDQETQRMQLEAARQARADDIATRQVFQQGGSESEILHRLMAANPKAGMAYQKQLQDVHKNRVEISAKELETAMKRAERGASILATVRDQPSYDMARRQLAADFGAAAIANMPEQFDPQFVQGRIAMGQTITQRLAHEHQQATLAQTRANDPFTAGPGGASVPNPTVQEFQLTKSAKAAPNVNVKAEVKTGESLGQQVGPMMKDSAIAADGAVKQVDAARRIVEAVDSGKIITGPLANQRIVLSQVGQVLGIGGKDEATRLANTRAAIRGMAELTLQGRQQMRGQGAITESEGMLAERAMSADINLTAAEIRQLAEASERAARWNYAEHQRKLGIMQANPDLADMAPFFQGPAMPPERPRRPAPGAPGTPRPLTGTPATMPEPNLPTVGTPATMPQPNFPTVGTPAPMPSGPGRAGMVVSPAVQAQRDDEAAGIRASQSTLEQLDNDIASVESELRRSGRDGTQRGILAGELRMLKRARELKNTTPDAPAPTAAAAVSRPQSFNSMPDPSQYFGKVVTDTKTQIKYRSDGSKWVKQ